MLSNYDINWYGSLMFWIVVIWCLCFQREVILLRHHDHIWISIFLWRQFRGGVMPLYGKWVCLLPYMGPSFPPWVFELTKMSPPLLLILSDSIQLIWMNFEFLGSFSNCFETNKIHSILTDDMRTLYLPCNVKKSKSTAKFYYNANTGDRCSYYFQGCPLLIPRWYCYVCHWNTSCQ